MPFRDFDDPNLRIARKPMSRIFFVSLILRCKKRRHLFAIFQNQPR